MRGMLTLYERHRIISGILRGCLGFFFVLASVKLRVVYFWTRPPTALAYYSQRQFPFLTAALFCHSECTPNKNIICPFSQRKFWWIFAEGRERIQNMLRSTKENIFKLND